MSTLGKMSVGVRRITTGLRMEDQQCDDDKSIRAPEGDFYDPHTNRMHVGHGGIPEIFWYDRDRSVSWNHYTNPPVNAILETAEDLFYREGIRAVGIDTIIEKSCVAKMSLIPSLHRRMICRRVPGGEGQALLAVVG